MAAAAKSNKNQFRRAKKKALKQQNIATEIQSGDKEELDSQGATSKDKASSAREDAQDEDDAVSAQEDTYVDEGDPLFQAYKSIIDRFQDADKQDPASKEADKPEVYFDDDEEIYDEEQEIQQQEKISKKKRKEQNQLSVAELKALVNKPESVEWTDTSATDPRLLVHIKAYRNVVPVPSHWQLKREYLSSKRGVEKASFILPKFIQETGIAEMRDAVLEKDDQASLKQKQRERVQPKMGKLDIDYQKLYEAFFRFQTKPELTRYGEVYYEGKEYETNLKHLRPGELSSELKDALNIPPGAPPPWLINQQRFGPPPSYPSLRIPGLNAPPPPGCSWGFHPGGYGKPPVDEYNRPIYGGDIFGVVQPQQNTQIGEPVEKTLWGELQEPEEESEEEDDEEDEDSGDDLEGVEREVGGKSGIETELPHSSGLETPGGLVSTVPSEYGGKVSGADGDDDNAGAFELRKNRRGIDSEEPRRQAYQVLPEQKAQVSGFFGGDRTYDLKGAQNQRADNLPLLDQQDGDDSRRKRRPGDVDVAMDPDSLLAKDGIDKEEVRRMYDSERKQEQNGKWSFEEDLSDMVASESRKRLKRDEERRTRR